MHREPDLIVEPLGINIIDGELVMSCTAMPSLTPAAARGTAKRLIEAADRADSKALDASTLRR